MAVALLLGVAQGACLDTDPEPLVQGTRSQAARDPLRTPGHELLTMPARGELIHASAGAGVLLWGLPARHPAPGTGQRPTYKIRAVSVAGGQAPPRVAVAGDPEVLDAVVSRAGDRVAAVLAGDHSLVVAGAQGGIIWRRAGADAGLAFAPDGKQLAHACAAGGAEAAWETDICLLDLRDGSHRRLFRLDGPQGQPSFSADGRAVLFVSGHTGVAAVWSVGLAGRAPPAQLTNMGRGPGPRFVPVPATLRGALAVGRHLVYDTGRAVISVRRGRARSLAPGGALVVPAARPGTALLLRPGAAPREVTP